MTLNEPTENSKGLRFGSFVQIRDIISEEMEAVVAINRRLAKQAADDVVSAAAMHCYASSKLRTANC
jgi:sn-glycerol 3-phosphate transport system substrate-binding protein